MSRRLRYFLWLGPVCFAIGVGLVAYAVWAWVAFDAYAHGPGGADYGPLHPVQLYGEIGLILDRGEMNDPGLVASYISHSMMITFYLGLLLSVVGVFLMLRGFVRR